MHQNPVVEHKTGDKPALTVVLAHGRTLTPAYMRMPAYVTTSETDPFVPAARVRETADWLIASGAITTARIFAARAHEVSDEEIAAARALLAALT